MKVERIEGSLHRRLIDGEVHVRCSKLKWWDKSIRWNAPGSARHGKSLTGERGRRVVTYKRRRYVALADGNVYVLMRKERS